MQGRGGRIGFWMNLMMDGYMDGRKLVALFLSEAGGLSMPAPNPENLRALINAHIQRNYHSTMDIG